MPRLSKKHRAAILKVMSRWVETLSNARPVNYDRIRELINGEYARPHRKIDVPVKTKANMKRGRWQRKYKSVPLAGPTIHFLKSPVAFDIAQAVIRGYVSKDKAAKLCAKLGVDTEFLQGLRRDYLQRSFGNADSVSRWRSGYSTVSDAWEVVVGNAIYEARVTALGEKDEVNLGRWTTNGFVRTTRSDLVRRFPALDNNTPDWVRDPQHRIRGNNDVQALTGWRQPRANGPASLSIGNFFSEPLNDADSSLRNVTWSSQARNALLCRNRLTGASGYSLDYIDAEVMFELLGVKDPAQIWAQELMHEAHAVMLFRRQVLVLADAPTMHFNGNNELHNDEGPAVHWADGASQYFIDGHELGGLGKYICEQPEKLTLEMIRREANEEVKRLAIDRYGWNRYLTEINAQVIDTRNNAVDNTIEALIRVPVTVMRRDWARGGWHEHEETIYQHKLVLSCRSTARQYFLAVPDSVRFCENGQSWMANGATTSNVPALSRQLNVVGAS